MDRLRTRRMETKETANNNRRVSLSESTKCGVFDAGIYRNKNRRMIGVRDDFSIKSRKNVNASYLLLSSGHSSFTSLLGIGDRCRSIRARVFCDSVVVTIDDDAFGARYNCADRHMPRAVCRTYDYIQWRIYGKGIVPSRECLKIRNILNVSIV